MRTPFLTALLAATLVTAACREPVPDPPDVLSLVDPIIGTAGGGFSQPQAFPGAAVPFGMVKPGPDTFGPLLQRTGFAHTAGYWWHDEQIDGFSQLHFHGTGVEDYGNVLVQAIDGFDASKVTESGYSQSFSHDTEEASPGYYAVTLEETGVRAELSASEHAAIHRYTFPTTVAAPGLVVDVSHGLGKTGALDGELTWDGTALTGHMMSAGRFTGEGRAFEVYFDLTFEPAPTLGGTWTENIPTDGATTASGPELGAWLTWPAGTETVVVRAGMSYIDVTTASANRAEVAGTFDEVHEAARAAWKTVLGRMPVWGGTEADQRMYYTGLYHAAMLPTLMTESDGRFRGLDRVVYESGDARFYSDISMWDTYRTEHSLLSLWLPEVQHDVAETFLRMGEQLGAVPRWPLAVNGTGTMVGSPASIIFTDTVLRGGTGLDLDKALAMMVDDANGVDGHTIRGQDALNCNATGWCPDDLVTSSAAKTIEYGWADFAIANLARHTGDTSVETDFAGRATNWRNLWDDSVGFVRGKDSAGNFPAREFDELLWTAEYTEGNAWHYVFAAFFDPAGLEAEAGGGTVLREKLDHFFELSEATPTPILFSEPIMDSDPYYWHGNEPDIHAAHTYAAIGQPGAGQKWVDWVRTSKYNDGPDGLAGNDDAGTLSSWYVLTSLGLYPMAGSDVWVLSAPIWDRAEVPMGEGQLVIETEGTGRFIAGVKLDKQAIDRPWLTHAELSSAERLVFELSETDTGWGQADALVLGLP